MQAQDLRQDLRLGERLRWAKKETGIDYAQIALDIGISRSYISGIANGRTLPSGSRADQLDSYLRELEEQKQEAPTLPPTPTSGYKDTVEFYETDEVREAMGWLSYVQGKRKMGVMVGHPGIGKTTILKEFARRFENAHYIVVGIGMRMGDLLAEIARVAGISIRGNVYRRTQMLIEGLALRKDVMLLIDEAEYLKKWDVDKFEVLRKIWDETGTPMVFCGTHELEHILTRGSGRENLAQLYRRKMEIKLRGITGKEAMQILSNYPIEQDAAAALAEVAMDTRHGGMGNFVEVLEVCLEEVIAHGGSIMLDTVRNAMKYKLTY